MSAFNFAKKKYNDKNHEFAGKANFCLNTACKAKKLAHIFNAPFMDFCELLCAGVENLYNI